MSRGKLKKLRNQPRNKKNIIPIFNRKFARSTLKKYRKSEKIKNPNMLQQMWRNFQIKNYGLIQYFENYKKTVTANVDLDSITYNRIKSKEKSYKYNK